MIKADLKPCPFCGATPKLKEFHETADGRGDRWAEICCHCRVSMTLTLGEFEKAEKDFGYIGGYYSSNEKFWNGMHQRLIDKWNKRKEK